MVKELVSTFKQDRFRKVKKTRGSGTCWGCGKKILKGSKAIAIVTIEHWSDGKALQRSKDFLYFHNMDCMNEWDAKKEA